MARKKKTVADDVMDLVALLPWWAGIALAVLSYALFHALAVRPLPVMTNPNQVAGAMPGIMLRGVASGLQFLVPMLCLVGALLSFLRRRQRQKLVVTATASRSADVLSELSWHEFELLTGEAFRLQGFQVEESGGSRPDGGVDLRARKGTEIFLVQCKQWRALQVGVAVVRELYGVMAAEGAAGGYVVTSGQFTPDARAFAEGRNIRLIDGTKLFGLLQQAQQSLKARAGAVPASASPTRSPASADASPACPQCSAPMVRRMAKKGANAGSQFWGCSKFPACRGTR
jgi:restriction system protein